MTRPTAIFANLEAFLANRVGDFGFALGIGLIVAYTGSLATRRYSATHRGSHGDAEPGR
jgi:NADH:ubiquinone oxidoreductase subunit 5 (subunit L)/multisubunit Na+/H+ antiporter MnhA subunit